MGTVPKQPIKTRVVARLKKTGGNLRIIDEDALRFARFKSDIPEGVEVEAEFRGVTPPSSDRSLKYFHALRDEYANALGYDKERAKNELCCMYGVALEADGLDEIPPWSGHVITIWERVYYRKSVADYTKKEMNALIEGVKQACFDNGVDISEVSDIYEGL